MKVKNKSTNEVVEATKNPDNTYTVEGNTLSKEDMGKAYMMVKVAPKKEEPKEQEFQVINSNETMSDDITKIAMSLVKANGEMVNGKKGKEGYNYKYMTFESLVDLVRPVLLKHGLCIMQTHQLNGSNVATHTTVLHESGQWFKSTMEIPLSPSKQLSIPQQVGVVCTFSKRYIVQSIFMIASEDDNDGVIK
jgi:hypothetical protein